MIKKGKDICESRIASYKEGYQSYEDINTDADHVKSQKNPTNNTAIESHHDNKKKETTAKITIDT